MKRDNASDMLQYLSARWISIIAMASFAVGLIFGLAPAWQVTGLTVSQALGTESRTTTRGGRFRSVLVVARPARR